MKIVEWCEDDTPELMDMEGGCYLLEDSIFQHNLASGDLIQYMTERGTKLYHVLMVEPADDQRIGYGLNLVWIEAA